MNKENLYTIWYNCAGDLSNKKTLLNLSVDNVSTVKFYLDRL